MQHKFYSLPNMPNELCTKFHAWVSKRWKWQKLQFWLLLRGDLMQRNLCFGRVFATFATDTYQFTVEWTHNKNKISPCWNYPVIIALLLCTKYLIDNIFSMFIWPVYMYQWSHGILFESSRFNDHVGLEKLFFHLSTKIQLRNVVNHKSSWGVPPIDFYQNPDLLRFSEQKIQENYANEVKV